jgi:hypothetical protein
MVNENESSAIDDNIVRGVVSLEDLFESFDRSVERYARMELYLYIQLVTGPEMVQFGSRLQKAVAKACKIEGKYLRTYWKSRGMKVVERAMRYSRQHMNNSMKKRFVGTSIL